MKKVSVLMIVFLISASALLAQKKPIQPIDWKSATSFPSVDYTSFIKAIELNEKGDLQVLPFSGIYIPSKDIAGKSVDYSQAACSKGKARIKVQLQYDKEVLISSCFYVSGERDIYKQLSPAEPAQTTLTKGGNYSFDLFLDDQVFYHFDFEVAMLTSPDQADKKIFLLKSPWTEYLVFDVRSIAFEEKVIPRIKYLPSGPDKETSDGRWTTSSIKVYKDGKPFACASANGIDTIVTNRYFFGSLQEAKEALYTPIVYGNKKQPVKYAGLEDGNYIFYLQRAKDPVKEYTFDVKEGRIVLPAYQDRDKTTDPIRFIESTINDVNDVVYIYLKPKK